MLTDLETAEAAEMTTTVFRRLRERAGRTLPVLADGRLAGLVTKENVGEFLSIQAALEK